MNTKEYTDHKNGYRYYVENSGGKIKLTIVTYPEKKLLLKTDFTYSDYCDFIKYISDIEPVKNVIKP